MGRAAEAIQGVREEEQPESDGNTPPAIQHLHLLPQGTLVVGERGARVTLRNSTPWETAADPGTRRSSRTIPQNLYTSLHRLTAILVGRGYSPLARALSRSLAPSFSPSKNITPTPMHTSTHTHTHTHTYTPQVVGMVHRWRGPRRRAG